jgi:hypothetical protein
LLLLWKVTAKYNQQQLKLWRTSPKSWSSWNCRLARCSLIYLLVATVILNSMLQSRKVRISVLVINLWFFLGKRNVVQI